MSSKTRYLKRVRFLTEEEAKSYRDDLIAEARSRLNEAIQEFRSAIESPLKRYVEFQESVEPGHPEYNDASFHFSPILYAGEWDLHEYI